MISDYGFRTLPSRAKYGVSFWEYFEEKNDPAIKGLKKHDREISRLHYLIPSVPHVDVRFGPL